jgi:putative membrane protein
MSTDTTGGRLVTVLLVALGAVLLLPLLFMSLGSMGHGGMMGGPWGGGMWGDGAGMAGWAFLLSALLRLALLAALVAGGYLLYRELRSDGEDAALEELRLAYARGDLSDEEFERRRERLDRED